MESAHFIIVGGGHAAGQLADSLRREKIDGRITVITEEALPPYQRPHLSKLYLAGKLPLEKLLYRPREFYVQHDVEVMLGKKVASIVPTARSISLSDGSKLNYDKLALCTGASVRRLNIPGSDNAGVFYLRTVADTDQIRASLETARNVVFIGGGSLGMEAAGVVAAMGKRVTVLEMQARIMAATVAPQISEFYHKLHTERGVDIRTGVGVNSIHQENGRVVAVQTSEGKSIPADMVMISVGVTANTTLAETAGLRCHDGICVDEYAQTSDPHIVAAGDCTRHPNSFLGRELRLESVHNAVEQAKTAAATMCGRKMAYAQVPWFWSDQHEYRLQMVGIPAATDTLVMRGDSGAGSFSVLYFREDNLSACQAVNRPADYISCRKIMENNIPFSPRQAADPRFNPGSLVPPKARLAFQKRSIEMTA